MLNFEEYTAKNYKQNELNQVSKLLTEYSDEQKEKVAILLMDLAHIHANATND